jgi:RimJ/RimL family protein N-acetyltransferase
VIASDLESPTLDTARLSLRRPKDDDERPLARIANNWAIARQTEALPHPFTLDHARAWIGGGSPRDWRFVIAERETGTLMGALGLFVRHEDWEIGFWVAKPHWNRGFASEAAGAAAAFAFDTLSVAKLTAAAFADNKAAARVLEKVGFTHLGALSELLPERGGKRLVSWFVLDRANLVRP